MDFMNNLNDLGKLSKQKARQTACHVLSTIVLAASLNIPRFDIGG